MRNKWLENLKDRIEDHSFGLLNEAERHELFALIEMCEGKQKVIGVLEGIIAEKLDDIKSK